MTRFSRPIFASAALLLVSAAQAIPTDTAITGSLSKAENTCVSPISLFTSFPPESCSYSGGEDVFVSVGLGQFKSWLGPLDSGGFYTTGTGPDPLTTGGSMPADGKANLPITGTVTIEDNNTPGNGGDDSISGTLIIGAGERAVSTSNGNALESFSSVTHTIPARVVDHATPNAEGGYDYVIGSAGFPLLLHSAYGDDYPSESASIASGSTIPPDFNAWDQANGGNIPVINMPFPAGPPPLSQGPYTWEIVTYAPVDGNIGPNIGVATTAVITDHVCIAGDGAGNLTGDCDPNPALGSPGTWMLAGAEFDNLIIRLSTDANSKIVAADAFYTLEYKIPSLNANRDQPGSFIGGTLSFIGDSPDDSDGDGVNDELDSCPGTGADEAVNAKGCSIADLCSCEGDWKNVGAYVRCVAHTAQEFLAAGVISENEKGTIVSTAAGSKCGVKE